MTSEEVNLAIIVMAHPFGLHLEAIGDRNEGSDFALCGLKVIGIRGDTQQ